MSLVRTLILPAAGFGTRMRGVSPTLPKELLPLGPGRVLDFALREAEDAGMETVVCILRPGKEALRERLERRAASCRLLFLEQRTQRGEADAMALARDAAGDAPFAALYPDNVGHPAPGMLRELCAAFARRDADIVALSRVTRASAPTVGNSGRVRLAPLPERDGGPDAPPLRRILEFLPKGPGSFPLRNAGEWRTCGLFIALPHFFEAIDAARARGFSGELTDGKVRRVLLAQGAPFYGLPLSREVHDVGNPEGYARLRALLDAETPEARA